MERQKVFEKVGGFDPDSSNVAESGTVCFAIEFANAQVALPGKQFVKEPST